MTPASKMLVEFQDKKSDFYIEFNQSAIAVKLPKTRNAVAKLFKGKEKHIKAFLKKHKIKVTKEEDLIKLIQYANSL